MPKYYIIVFYILTTFCNCSDKVQLSVYLESLCPDSRNFVNRQLTPTYQSLSQLFNVEFIPFGNSWYHYDSVTKELVFRCQHGPQECLGNKFQSCLVVTAANNTQLSVDFIDCMFRDRRWTQPDISAKNCADKHSIDWNILNGCATGPLGDSVELEMANKTNSLNPPQNWIPWITVDGNHTNDIQTKAETNLKRLICDSYKGIKPDQCDESAQQFDLFEMIRYFSGFIFWW